MREEKESWEAKLEVMIDDFYIQRLAMHEGRGYMHDVVSKKVLKDFIRSLIKKPEELTASCGVCGGKRVIIRGRTPQDEHRWVCPTCLRERLDQINEISSQHYGEACQQPSQPIGSTINAKFGEVK